MKSDLSKVIDGVMTLSLNAPLSKEDIGYICGKKVGGNYCGNLGKGCDPWERFCVELPQNRIEYHVAAVLFAKIVTMSSNNGL